MTRAKINLQDAKILVTGGTGFIGSRVIRKLIAEGVPARSIRVLYYPGSMKTAIEDLDVEFFPANILDQDRVEEAVKGRNYVWHLVGNTSFDGKAKKFQWLINVEGTRNVLNACLKESIEKLVYTSTCNTLGCPFPIGSLGDEKTSPYISERPEIGKEVPKSHTFDSPEEALEFADAIHENRASKKWWKKIGIGYFDSKLAAQEIVNRYYKDEGLPVVSVLPGTNFGPGDEFIGSGLYILRIRNNALPGYTKGSGSPLVHVDDQATGHYLAMINGKVGERYCITGFDEDNRTQKDMFEIIAEVIREKEPNRKIKTPSLGIGRTMGLFVGTILDFFSVFRKQPFPIGRDAIRAACFLSFYSCAKARKEIKYSPSKSFRQAVSEMYDYYKERGYLDITDRRELV
ncbi:MAG: NAD-dependent epimerase/dehydratase family protein [Candidatus Helarchaeota archaeon]